LFGGIEDQIATDEVLAALLTLAGGWKGISTLGGIAAVLQLAMKFFQTPLAKFAGVWRLTIVAGLSVIATVLGLMVQGQEFLPSLLSGGVLAAVQVFGHQIFKQIKKGD